jgi:hypothetical protein
VPLVGVPLVGVPLVGVPLVGVPLVGVPLVGVLLVGVPLVGVPLPPPPPARRRSTIDRIAQCRSQCRGRAAAQLGERASDGRRASARARMLARCGRTFGVRSKHGVGLLVAAGVCQQPRPANTTAPHRTALQAQAQVFS